MKEKVTELYPLSPINLLSLRTAVYVGCYCLVSTVYLCTSVSDPRPAPSAGRFCRPASRCTRPPPADPARLTSRRLRFAEAELADLLLALWESQRAACRTEVLRQPLGRTGATAEQLEGEAGGVTGGEGSREGVGQLGTGRGGGGWSWGVGVRCVMGNLTGWGDWKGIGRWGWSGNGVGCRGNGVDGGRGVAEK